MRSIPNTPTCFLFNIQSTIIIFKCVSFVDAKTSRMTFIQRWRDKISARRLAAGDLPDLLPADVFSPEAVKSDQYLLISVADTGRGIGAEDIKNYLSPFFKLVRPCRTNPKAPALAWP